MNVVSFSLDPKVLDPESVTAIRMRAYGAYVGRYDVLVPTPATMTVTLSDSVTVYGISGKNKVSQLWNMYRQLTKLVRDGKCDVITSSDMYYIGFISLFVARRYHLGLEIQVLGIEKLNAIRKLIATYVLKRASVVRALSKRLFHRLIEEFGVEESRMHVVPIYVDISTLGLDTRTLDESDTHTFERLSSQFREAYGGYFNFLTVSRLVPIKRISMQLQALKKLITEQEHIRLHIVGDGPLEKELKNEVKNLGLEKYVIFHGRQSGLSLGVFYQECDAFVFTSAYEGWGMVIIEAATAGLPVVMTDVGCAGEFITHNESGLIVPVSDEDALLEAMKRVVTDPHLRETLSLGTKKALASLQSFDEVLKQYKRNWDVALAHRL